MSEQPFFVDQAATLRRMVTPEFLASAIARPRIVSIVSGKGGVGKSTVALNVALAVAERGKRTLLVDADPNLGNIDIMLGASPRYRLGHVLRGEIDIEDALFSPSAGLQVLAGSSGDAEYPGFDEGRSIRLFEQFATTEDHFDIVIIDSGAGLNKENTHNATHSDQVVIVTTVEPSAILDAYAVIKMIVKNNSGVDLKILLNQVRTPREGDEAAQKLMKAVKHFLEASPEYLGFIPFDEAVTAANVAQEPVTCRFPYAAASLSIRKVSQYLTAEDTPRAVGKKAVLQ
jgi:flagellar biosynthesis protein FlhG